MKLIVTKPFGNDGYNFVTTYRISRIIPGNLSVSFLKAFADEKLSWEHLDFFVRDYINPNFGVMGIWSVRQIVEIYYFDYTNKDLKVTNYVIRFPITFLNSDLVPNIARAITLDERKTLFDLKNKLELHKNTEIQFGLFLKIYESLFALQDFRLDRIKIYRSFAFSEDELTKIFPDILELSDSDSDSE